MANDNRNTNGQFMYSPADDLADMPSPGAHSNPGQPSIYPDVDMTGAGGDSAPNSKPAESHAGMGETVSTGGASGVLLADGPTEPSADLGNQLAGGLGEVPRPSGSY